MLMVLGAVLALALVLTGCSSEGGTGGGRAGTAAVTSTTAGSATAAQPRSSRGRQKR